MRSVIVPPWGAGAGQHDSLLCLLVDRSFGRWSARIPRRRAAEPGILFEPVYPAPARRQLRMPKAVLCLAAPSASARPPARFATLGAPRRTAGAGLATALVTVRRALVAFYRTRL